MLELMVDLDFACCSCGCTMGVTLKCAGKGLAGGAHSVAAVKVPCPTCSNTNQVYFEPSGMIHAVTPFKRKWWFPEPSLN
jgi:phage FluMu protein Com